jgi:hypothetical protein
MVMQTIAQPVTANVIPGTGVPRLWSTVISDAEAVASVELDTLLQSTLIKQADKLWGLFDSSNKPVLTSGRVRAIDARAAARITDAPQENGAFMSYNKVLMPGQIMLEILCDGTTMSYGNYGAISNLEGSKNPLALAYSDGSKGGRPPFDPVLISKILVIQTLNNLSDERTEYLINDRLSFVRFLGLGLSDRVPDAKTVWLFRSLATNPTSPSTGNIG